MARSPKESGLHLKGENMVLIKNLEIGEFFEGFYLIKSVELRQTRAGKDFLALSFQDRTGTINGNIWDANPKAVEQFRAGRVVHMKALKELYNGMPQVNKIQLRLATDSEPNQPHDYRESSPVQEKDLREYVQSILFKIENATLNRIVRTILKKFDKEFYEFPAAIPEFTAEGNSRIQQWLLFGIEQYLRASVSDDCIGTV